MFKRATAARGRMVDQQTVGAVPLLMAYLGAGRPGEDTTSADGYRDRPAGDHAADR